MSAAETNNYIGQLPDPLQDSVTAAELLAALHSEAMFPNKISIVSRL